MAAIAFGLEEELAIRRRSLFDRTVIAESGIRVFARRPQKGILQVFFIEATEQIAKFFFAGVSAGRDGPTVACTPFGIACKASKIIGTW